MSQYQPQQSPQPGRPPRTSRQRAVIAVVASIGALFFLFIVIGIVGAALAPAHHHSATGQAQPRPSVAVVHHRSAAPAAPQFGTVVYDGDFAFTVQAMSCGAAAARAVDQGGFGEKVPAGATECIVTMKVADDKSAAQQFFDSNQFAYDARGRQFSADTEGGAFLKGDQDATQLNPGISVVALVPFQVPAGDKIVRLVLHDSMLSGGVSVRL